MSSHSLFLIHLHALFQTQSGSLRSSTVDILIRRSDTSIPGTAYNVYGFGYLQLTCINISFIFISLTHTLVVVCVLLCCSAMAVESVTVVAPDVWVGHFALSKGIYLV